MFGPPSLWLHAFAIALAVENGGRRSSFAKATADDGRLALLNVQECDPAGNAGQAATDGDSSNKARTTKFLN
jgi:hypothetical protein